MSQSLIPNILALFILLISASPALAQAPASLHATNKILTTMNLFYYADANDQDGKELPGGSTMLSGISLGYIRPEYYTGVGFFTHMDSVGLSQKNSAMGIKLELFLPSQPYYFEYGFAFSAEQKFKERAVKSRTGSMSFMGVGVRVPLTTWLYFDGSFKQRKWSFDKEDGVGLAKPVNKQERIPYLGLGIAFNI